MFNQINNLKIENEVFKNEISELKRLNLSNEKELENLNSKLKYLKKENKKTMERDIEEDNEREVKGNKEKRR